MLFSEGDLRVGGEWRAGMRSLEGREYVMFGRYREIVAPQRLVFTHGWEDKTKFTTIGKPSSRCNSKRKMGAR